MGFDLIFLVRDRAPQLFELTVAVAAMASASAILTFALTLLLRRVSGPGAPLIALGLLSLAPREAMAHFGLHEHRDLTVAAGETHEGTLVASTRTVSIDGIVDGDLLVLAERLAIRGEVRGNVIAIAEDLEIPGLVLGSVHVASERAHVSGRIGGSLYAVGDQLVLGSAGRIERDLLLGASDAIVEGSVERDVAALAGSIELRGRVGRDVNARAERLAILDGARIGGGIRARLPAGREIQRAPAAEVAGPVDLSFDEGHRGPGFSRFLEPRFYLWMALHVTAAFLLGIALRAVAPGIFEQRIETAGAFFRVLGIGLAAALAGPLAAALVGLTIVGLPIALMGLAVWAASLYVGLVVVGSLIGASSVRVSGARWSAFASGLVVGLAILVFVTHLPYVGPVAWVLAVLTGLGLLVDGARRAWSRRARAGA